MLNKGWDTFMLGYNYAVNRLTQETNPMRDTKDNKLIPYTTMLKHINAKPFGELTATLVMGPKIKWWQPALTLMVRRVLGYELEVFDKKITNPHPLVGIRFDNQVTLPWDTYITVFILYLSADGWAYNMLLLAPIFTSEASITKKWLKDMSLSTSLQLSNFIRGNQNIQVATRYTETIVISKNTPRISLNISYRFNATRDKYKGKGALGSVVDACDGNLIWRLR